MFEPGAIGKALGGREFALTIDEQFVDFGERRGPEHCSAARIGPLNCLAILLRAAREHIHGVLEGREIQVRRNRFGGRRHKRLLGVIGGHENAFLDFLVAFTNVVLHLLRKSFQLLQVGLYGVRKVAELERKQIRVRQAHHGRAAGLGEGAAIHEIRVAKVREPIEIIVNGVVDAAAIFTTEPDIEGGHAVVLKKRGVV